MFSNKVRLFILLTFLLLLGILVYIRIYELAAVSVLMILLLIWDYYRQGTLVVAAKFFHQKDFDKAELLLKEVPNPNWLSKKRRGYYEYMYGGICIHRQNFNAAAKHYETASQYPLRSVNDHVAALATVANISINQGEYDKAKAYLQLAENHKEKITAKMKDVIRKLNQELKKH